MKKRKKQKSQSFLTMGIIMLVAAIMLSGCGNKENLPTEQELTNKIAAKQEQTREQKMTDAKKELDQYFDFLAVEVKQLGDKRTVFFKAFTELSEDKITEKEAQNRAASAITNYEKTLNEFRNISVPSYNEVQEFHQEIYRTMSAYVPLMKKAEQGLRAQDPALLKDVEKQMAALDIQAKKTLEKTANLRVKIKMNQ